MAQVLLQYTQCTAQDLAGYEEKAFANSTTKNQAKSERVKREMFRKLAARVCNHIGFLSNRVWRLLFFLGSLMPEGVFPGQWDAYRRPDCRRLELQLWLFDCKC